jgi:hypothetical protein
MRAGMLGGDTLGDALGVTGGDTLGVTALGGDTLGVTDVRRLEGGADFRTWDAMRVCRR